MIKQRKFDAIQPVTVKLQSEIFKAFFSEAANSEVEWTNHQPCRRYSVVCDSIPCLQGWRVSQQSALSASANKGSGSWRPLCPWTPCFKQDSVATKILCNGPIIGQEPVSIIHYTRSGSSIKLPTPNWEAALCHIKWSAVHPKSSYKTIDSDLSDPLPV